MIRSLKAWWRHHFARDPSEGDELGQPVKLEPWTKEQQREFLKPKTSDARDE